MSVSHLYVACCQRRGRDPLHWIILVVPPGSDRCTYYHVTGGPTQGRPYRLEIQANKRVNSHGIASTHFIGNIKDSDVNKLKASAQRAKLQRCQVWTVEVLRDLESKNLVPAGTYARWSQQIERSPQAVQGASSHPSAPQTSGHSGYSSHNVRPQAAPSSATAHRPAYQQTQKKESSGCCAVM